MGVCFFVVDDDAGGTRAAITADVARSVLAATAKVKVVAAALAGALAVDGVVAAACTMGLA